MKVEARDRIHVMKSEPRIALDLGLSTYKTSQESKIYLALFLYFTSALLLRFGGEESKCEMSNSWQKYFSSFSYFILSDNQHYEMVDQLTFK